MAVRRLPFRHGSGCPLLRRGRKSTPREGKQNRRRVDCELITDEENENGRVRCCRRVSYVAELERKKSLRVGFKRWFWRPVQIRE